MRGGPMGNQKQNFGAKHAPRNNIIKLGLGMAMLMCEHLKKYPKVLALLENMLFFTIYMEHMILL